MFRFTMPDTSLSPKAQKEELKSLFDRFLNSDALRELFLLLGVNRQTFSKTYNGRQSANGTVRELQELKPLESLDQFRNELYPMLYELGFFSINKPLHPENSHILVLGGSLNACYVRTQCAGRLLSPSTRFVDGLACYRPINPVERTNTSLSSLCDTEFGAMRDSFAEVFHLCPSSGSEDFLSNRNLNGISCVKTFSSASDELSYRVFAAPSTQPDLRRADTGDSFLFYLDKADIRPTDTLLAITHNRHCSRQFIQLAYLILKEQRSVNLDVIGCLSDEQITTVEQYDPFLYLQDLVGILDWIERFNHEL